MFRKKNSFTPRTPSLKDPLLDMFQEREKLSHGEKKELLTRKLHNSNSTKIDHLKR